MQMMENAAFIQKEIPSLQMADDLRSTIRELCDNLIGTKHDLIHEIFEIEPRIETKPDSAQVQHGIQSMRQWMAEAINSVNDCVARVQKAVTQGTAMPLLGMLVMESAVNILNAVPDFPEMEPEPADDDGECHEEEDWSDPSCYAFHLEDSYPVDQLNATIRDLSMRPDLPVETAEDLKIFLFAMERLQLVTPGVRMSLGLRLDQGGKSDWIEIRMEDGEFSLGRGAWVEGDAETETIFEVTPDYREGDAFQASNFALSFLRCAEDVCLEVVVEDSSDEPFTGWDLKQDKSRWSDLPCSFI
jgi:hypothetical protein